MRIRKAISSIFSFVIGNAIALVRYDRIYLHGRHFGYKRGVKKKLSAPGWKWIVRDCLYNKQARYPISSHMQVLSPENIDFDINDLNNFQNYGCYFQAIGHIKIGAGTYIAPNVGLITSNHDINDLSQHNEVKEIIIGSRCWIGMNSVILPGVILGNHTIVGAGSIVTKSFEQGKCVIAGNPAKVIRNI